MSKETLAVFQKNGVHISLSRNDSGYAVHMGRYVACDCDGGNCWSDHYSTEVQETHKKKWEAKMQYDVLKKAEMQKPL